MSKTEKFFMEHGQVISNFIVVIVLLICVCFVATHLEEKHQYPKTAIVVEVDKETDHVIVVDDNGMEWSFIGVEDWEVNDICSMIMNDKSTSRVTDDEIVECRYGGSIEE